MRARRTDSNQSEMRAAWRKLGGSWLSLAPEHGGEPDALVGWRGEDRIIEVKAPEGPKGGTSGRKLRPEQVEWHAGWRGRPPALVRSVQDIVALFALDILGD